MTNLLRAEFHKLKTSKLFYGLLAFMLIQGIVGPLIDKRLINKSGKDMLLFIFSNQQYLSLMMMIGVFSYFIGIEFSSGYIKNLISYGHKRVNILMAKSIAFYTGVVVITFPLPIYLAIINTVKNGYGEVFTFSSFLFLFRVLLIMMLINTAIASIAVLFTFVSKNTFVTIGLFFLLDFINRMLTALSLRNESIRLFYEKTIFAQTQFAILEDITIFQGVQAAAISLVTILVSTIIGLYFFKRGDIK